MDIMKFDKKTVQMIISSLIDGINQYSIEISIIRHCANKDDKKAQEIMNIKKGTIDIWTKRMNETINNNGFDIDEIIRFVSTESYIYDNKKGLVRYTYKRIAPCF